ncbi:MAG TPA: LytTR family DNA-binding domain-containing protein [Gemmatimonadaceae bacterium]|nr:LytTR family DNA-binding domain-containing protein [Gemmatimonadaceae bacterium]
MSSATIPCLIVEDEPLAQARLARYVERHSLLELRGTVASAHEALDFVRAEQVGLVFLDIGLGGMSGIELLETARLDAAVVLTTAHHEFALRAFDLQVADYLVKPFTFDRFAQAVDRARSLLPERGSASDRRLFFVKSGTRLERVMLRDLLYISGEDDYRCLHTTRKRLLTLETFGELEQRLPPELFCRVHKSYMVAIDRIESVERDRVVIGPAVIPVSETYRARFLSLIDRRRR